MCLRQRTAEGLTAAAGLHKCSAGGWWLCRLLQVREASIAPQTFYLHNITSLGSPHTHSTPTQTHVQTHIHTPHSLPHAHTAQNDDLL